MYARQLFENKLVKRKLHNYLTSKILSFNDRGCIVALAGPAVEVHYKELKPILRKNSELLFAEIDSEMAAEEKLIERVNKLKDKQVVIQIDDVWKAIINKYITKNGWEHKHVLFDFDFCCTAQTVVKNDLYSNLRWLSNSKLPRNSGFWVAMTFCKRKDINHTWHEIPSKMIDIFYEAGWNLTLNENLSYTEGHTGANMVNMLFRFKLDRNRM